MMDDTFLDKKWSGSGAVKSKNILNKQLAEELYNLIIRKFKNRKYIHLLWKTFWGLI